MTGCRTDLRARAPGEVGGREADEEAEEERWARVERVGMGVEEITV